MSDEVPLTPQDQPINPVEPPFPIQVEEPAKEAVSVPPPASPPVPPPVAEKTQVSEKPFWQKYLPFLIGLLGLLFLFFIIRAVAVKLQKPKIPENVTLKYWGLWEPENLMATIISDYQKLKPNVTIQYLRQSPKDYRERLQSEMAKGTGPDIFRWHNTWLPMLKADLAFIPDNIYTANEFDTTFYPVVKKDVFFNGHYFGVPLEIDTLVLYVNETILATQPDLKVPTTWDNLRQAAYKLSVRDSRGVPSRAGVALGTANNVDNFSDILGLMILQNGGDPGKPNNEQVTSAIKFYSLFSGQDRSWDESLPNSTIAFANSKVAMIIAPSWRALEIKQINPQLNFRMYPVPQLPGTNVSWASYWLEGVSKKSPQQQAAWEFIKYLSSKETLTKMYTLASQARLFGEPYSRQDMAGLLQADPFVGPIISQGISAQSWPLASRTFDNGLNDKLIKYYEDAINAYANNQAEETTLQNLTQGVSQVLSQYGLSSQ